MTAVTNPVISRAGGRPVLILRPDVSPGRCGVEMLSTLARARASAAAACFLPPEGDTRDLVAAATAADVPIVRADGWRGWWLRAQWDAASAARAGGARWRAGLVSVLQELYRELRRHAGNERLPGELRRRLRETAHRYYERSLQLRRRVAPYPRRLLRESSTFAWPEPLLERLRADAASHGIPVDARLVVLDVGLRPDVVAEALHFLTAQGYTVVRLGTATANPRALPGVINLVAPRSLLLEIFVLRAAQFVVCDSIERQQLAYLTNTPSLVLNAVDPFAAYPVRGDGLFTLRTAVDLESGRTLTIDELLSERYVRNLRACGFRDGSTADVVAALAEMAAGVEHGWDESAGQSRFRARMVEAGRALAAAAPAVAEWAPDAGFIGDGRLARFQADAA